MCPKCAFFLNVNVFCLYVKLRIIKKERVNCVPSLLMRLIHGKIGCGICHTNKSESVIIEVLYTVCMRLIQENENNIEMGIPLFSFDADEDESMAMIADMHEHDLDFGA